MLQHAQELILEPLKCWMTQWRLKLHWGICGAIENPSNVMCKFTWNTIEFLTRRAYHWAFIACLLFCLTSTSVCTVRLFCNIQRHTFSSSYFSPWKDAFSRCVCTWRFCALNCYTRSNLWLFTSETAGHWWSYSVNEIVCNKFNPIPCMLTFFTLKSQGKRKISVGERPTVNECGLQWNRHSLK